MPANFSVPPSALDHRRLRRHARPTSARRSIYDGFAMCLLMAAPLLGVFLFGAVRLWSVGPLMVLTFLGAALVFLRAFFNRELRRLQAPPGGYVGLVLLAYVLVITLLSPAPRESRVEFLRIASLMAAYWAWAELAAWHRRRRFLLGALIFVTTLIAWYAIVQHAQGTRMVLNLVRPAVYQMRASGTYFCPNHFAHLLEIVLCLCLALLLLPAAGGVLRVLAGYALLLIFPVLYLTQSRSGWLGAAAGAGVTLLLIAVRRGRKAFLAAVVGLPALIGAGAYAAWLASPMVRERVAGAMTSAPDSAVIARFLMWKDTLAMIAAKPLWGHGPGLYRYLYEHFKSHNLPFWFSYAHNEYLHAAAEFGLVGLALLAAFTLAVMLRLLVKVWRAGRDKDAYLVAALWGSAVASLVHAVFDFNLHVYGNMQMLVLLAGIVVAGLYASGELRPVQMKSPWWCFIWGGGALASLVLALLAAQATVSYGLNYLGDQAREGFKMDKARGLYSDAIAVDRANWEPYLGMAHTYKTESFWNLDPDAKKRQATEAVAWYEKARALNPYDMEVVLGEGRARSAMGDAEAAIALFQSAVEYAPRELPNLVELGLAQRFAGRYEEALDTFTRAAKLGVPSRIVPANIELLRRKIAKRAQEKTQE